MLRRTQRRPYKYRFFVREQRELTLRSDPKSQGICDPSTIQEYRLPGIRGVVLPEVFEGVRAFSELQERLLTDRTVADRHVQADCHLRTMIRFADMSVRAGFSGVAGQYRVVCEVNHTGVGVYLTVRYERFTDPLGPVVAGGRNYLRRSACPGSALFGIVRSERSHGSSGLRVTRLSSSIPVHRLSKGQFYRLGTQGPCRIY